MKKLFANKRWATYFALLAVLTFAASGMAFAMKSQGTNVESAAPIIHEISLIDGAAFPNELIVKLGDRVQFNSKDGQSHDISSGKGNDYDHDHDHVATEADSGHIEADEGYLVSFTEAGTYYFHDHYNPDAFITILVYTPEEGSE